MPTFSPIDYSFLQGALRQDQALSQAPVAAQGQLGSRQVQARPHAHKVTPGPENKALPRPAEAPSLGRRQARAAGAAPKLLRQARYAALPSAHQLPPSAENAGKVVRNKGLPSVGELVARAGPARHLSLLERFLNLLRGAKPPDSYQMILKGLTAYHDTCQRGTAQDAMRRLNGLEMIVARHDPVTNDKPHRTEVIKELRTQIASERTMLNKVMAELVDCKLPPGATVSHALGFFRSGIPLSTMKDLVENGLKLGPAQEVGNGAKQLLGYEKILATLQAYHAACSQRSAGKSDAEQAKQTLAVLMELNTATRKYFEDIHKDHTNVGLTDLRDQIPREIAVLKGLHAELKSAGALPPGADLSHAMAFAREGVSLKDMTRLMAKGLLPSQATEARALMDSERASLLMKQLNERSSDDIARSEFSAGELLLLELSGLGLEGGKAYRHLGLPITDQTIAIEHTDEQRLGRMSTLGKGGFNEVYAARYNGPEGSFDGVFKPLTNVESGWVAAKIGIDLKHPLIANRNLATQDVARALGFDVVVECGIGARKQPVSGGQRLQVGLVMGRAPGQEAYKVLGHWRRDPEVRREVTKLQLLDHLVGQGDRHGGNYFVEAYKDERGRTKVKVSGIDNDQCFGKNTRSGDDIRYAQDAQRHGYRGTKMPELIDSDMAAAIRRITPQSLEALLSDKLSPDEVDAAQSRLQSLLEHISKLEHKGQVITPYQWNRRTDIGALQNASNSYFARDASRADAAF